MALLAFYGFPCFLRLPLPSMASLASYGFPCFLWLSLLSLAFLTFYGQACFLWLPSLSIAFLAFYGFLCLLWLSLLSMAFLAFYGVPCFRWLSLPSMAFLAFYGFPRFLWLSFAFYAFLAFYGSTHEEPKPRNLEESKESRGTLGAGYKNIVYIVWTYVLMFRSVVFISKIKLLIVCIVAAIVVLFVFSCASFISEAISGTGEKETQLVANIRQLLSNTRKLFSKLRTLLSTAQHFQNPKIIFKYPKRCGTGEKDTLKVLGCQPTHPNTNRPN
jgi:hypothetical protein